MVTVALEIVDLHVLYAQSHVANGVSFYAMTGEVIVLLGRDGSGRRAALQAINHQGLGLLTTEDGIIPDLTCEDNLLLPAIEGDTLGGAMSLTQIYELCPDLNMLRHTLGASLSCAEQRMLAIARTLRTGTNVLLMDDITDGLAPVMVQAFSNMILNLKRLGYTIIMGERHIEFSAMLADRFYVIDAGQVIDTFSQNDLPTQQERVRLLLTDDARASDASPQLQP